MFDHVTIRVSDRAASARFYETVLATIGIAKTASEGWLEEWGDFSISPADTEQPVTRGLHVGFAAPTRAAADEFWRTGTEAGYRDDGEPGPRPEYGPDYDGAFLLDPDGNSAEAVHNGPPPARGGIDHLWIRVADVERAKRFYETVAPSSGFVLADEPPGRARFEDADASFSVVDGRPTENVHIAFPASQNATVDEFHRAAIAAGYRDNGAPGERPIYPPGYYGAFVLDPDGNNVEVVSHNRG
jgi:catechol 2,3-dioxygenase-like lactoylglutathione lyase family enzyme